MKKRKARAKFDDGSAPAPATMAVDVSPRAGDPAIGIRARVPPTQAHDSIANVNRAIVRKDLP